MKKETFLESLRGYAILGVILTHITSKMNELPQWIYNFGIQGSRGVQLFFIVSAFTLFYSLSYKYNQKIDLKNFYIKRFFRIAPMFYFAFIFYCLFDLFTYIVGIKPSHNDYSIEMIFTSLTFISVLHPDWLYSLVPGGWSISSEIIFYLCVPILFRIAKNRYRALYFFVISLFIGMFSNYIMTSFKVINEESNYLFYWFPNQLFIFVLGIVLFHFWKETELLRRWKVNLVISSSLLALFILSITPFAMDSLFPKHLMFGIAFCFLAYGMGQKYECFLNNRIMQWIGKISFSMYLMHFFILEIVYYFISKLVPQNVSDVVILFIVLIFTSSITAFVSMFTYKYIELPGIKLGRYLAKWSISHNNKRNTA